MFWKAFLGLLTGGSVLAIALPNERGRIIEFMSAMLTLALAGVLFWWIARSISRHWRGTLKFSAFLGLVVALPAVLGATGLVISGLLVVGAFVKFLKFLNSGEKWDGAEEEESKRRGEPSMLGAAIAQGMRDGGGGWMFNQSRDDEEG